MAELALTGGTLEKSKWGTGGIAKVSFKTKWGLDRAQILIYLHTLTNTHTQLSLLSIQGGRVTHTRHKIQVVEPPKYMFTQKFTPFGLLLEHLANSYRFCKYTSLILDGEG